MTRQSHSLWWAAAFLLFACGVLSVAVWATTRRCGSYRWDLKTASDAEAIQLKRRPPLQTSVKAIAALSAPEWRLGEHRIGAERMLWVVEGTVDHYGKGTDGDLHLQMTDERKHDITLEVPEERCVSATSPFRVEMAAARQTILAQFGPASLLSRRVHSHVRVTGPLFYDRGWERYGRAEIHPIVKIEFSPDRARRLP